MNKEDWIQLLLIVIVFLVLVAIIYSLMKLAWWITLIELIIVFIIGYLVNKRIKL